MAGKPIFLYFLFFLAVFTLFLFLRFPGEKAAAYFTRSLAITDSNLKVSIGNVKPALPFHLEFENTEFQFGHDIVIKPESFTVYPGLFDFFKTEKTIDIRSNLQKGTIQSGLYLKTIHPFVLSRAKVLGSDIEIIDFKYITSLGEMILKCKMAGDINFDLGDKKIIGEGMVLFREFSAEMKNPFLNSLNIQVVDFSDIQFDFTHAENIITVKQCSAKGSTINVVLKGTIEIGFPVKESRLNLSGSLLPDSPYLAKFAHSKAVKEITKDITRDGIRFKITGTFKNPEIGL